MHTHATHPTHLLCIWPHNINQENIKAATWKLNQCAGISWNKAATLHRCWFYWKYMLTTIEIIQTNSTVHLLYPSSKKNISHLPKLNALNIFQQKEEWKWKHRFKQFHFHLYVISFTRCLLCIALKNIQMMLYINFYLFYTISVINVCQCKYFNRRAFSLRIIPHIMTLVWTFDDSSKIAILNWNKIGYMDSVDCMACVLGF